MIGANAPWPVTAPASGGSGFLGGLGVGGVLQIGGSLLGTIGTYYAAKSQAHALKTQAQDLEFYESMSAINARNAEREAQDILRRGADDISLLGLKYAQERSRFAVRAGAAGVDPTTGSAGEVAASVELSRRIETYLAGIDRTRAASAARFQATDIRNRGALAGVSAGNLRSSAAGINPFGEAFGTLLGSAGRAADYISRANR